MDIVFHLLLPFLILKLFGINHKWLPFLAFAAWIPDMDKFFGFNRMSFHNVFFVFLSCVLVFLFLYRKKDGKLLAGIFSFNLVSHIVLDLFGAIALFFPFDKSYYVAEFALKLSDGFPYLAVGLQKVAFFPSPPYEVVSTSAFALIALLAVLFFWKRKK